jgi:hypothetical protein
MLPIGSTMVAPMIAPMVAPMIAPMVAPMIAPMIAPMVAPVPPPDAQAGAPAPHQYHVYIFPEVTVCCETQTIDADSRAWLLRHASGDLQFGRLTWSFPAAVHRQYVYHHLRGRQLTEVTVTPRGNDAPRPPANEPGPA